ncbi:hypothetical protein Hdeb2414_s0001g00019881 [Helianthus debilis subsp. tardiflorus]
MEHGLLLHLELLQIHKLTSLPLPPLETDQRLRGAGAGVILAIHALIYIPSSLTSIHTSCYGFNG